MSRRIIVPNPVGVPGPFVSVSSTSLTQISVLAAPGSRLDIRSYQINFSTISPNGPWTSLVSAIPNVGNSLLVSHDGLAPGTTVYYQAAILYSTGRRSNFSPAVSAATPSSLRASVQASINASGTLSSSGVVSSSIKMTGGHWAAFSTVVKAGQNATAVQGDLNAIKSLQNIRGYYAYLTWACLEPTQGEADTNVTYPNGYATGGAVIQSFLTQLAAMTPTRKLVVNVGIGAFSKTHPGTTDFSVIPQYIQSNSAYGAAGYRAGGVVTNLTGQHGFWGGDGNGNTYAACFHRPAIQARLTKMAQVLGGYFDGDPNFEGITWDEDSFIIGASSTNACPDWSQTNFTNNVKTHLGSVIGSWPHTAVLWEESFAGTATDSQSVVAYMMSHRIDWSTTDVLGQTYVNSHSGNPYSWGAQTMCGKVPSGGTLAAVNYRDQGYMLSPQVQGPDMGAFGGIQGGFTPADILTDLNTTLKARKTFWIIMQPPASNWGSTLKAGATWDQLGPFLNDPANALTNTSRPVNYT